MLVFCPKFQLAIISQKKIFAQMKEADDCDGEL